MAALPKRKHSKARKAKRRSHLVEDLKKPSITKDSKSGHLVIRHRVNPKTGEYRGRKIIRVD